MTTPVSSLPLSAIGSWGAAEWTAVGQCALAVGALAAGVWAVYNFQARRKTEAAEWLQELFANFYLTDRFHEIRQLFEYRYDALIGPLMNRSIPDPLSVFTEEEESTMGKLDDFLNYLEWMVYLQDRGQLSRQDRQAMFEWWFDLLELPERAAARMYLRLGYERLAAEVVSDIRSYVVVYGTLRTDDEAEYEGKPELDTSILDTGKTVLLSGSLFDVGDYPGFVLDGDDEVVGQLWEVRSDPALRLMDRYEDYSPADPRKSEYVRVAISLELRDEDSKGQKDPRRPYRMCVDNRFDPSPPETPPTERIDAWVYVYNRKTKGLKKIGGGDWVAHLREREGTGRA